MAAAAPSRPRRAGCRRAGRLVTGGLRQRQRAGEKRGSADRGKPGVKIHVLADWAGLPLAVAVSAASIHDSQALQPPVKAVPAIRSCRGRRRRRPAKPHADKGYNYDHLRRWLHQRGITSRIARRGVHSSTRLGRHRWHIEPLLAQLVGYRRLASRCARRADLHCGLLTLAAALTCHKHLAT